MPGMRNDGDIGLVLSGGGAKGAFQAGVWKAMHELGLAERVKAISGTSVGAINAAAFATIHDPDEICRFWRERVEEVPTPNLRNLSVDSFRRAAENVLAGRAFPFHGLLDRRALEGLIRSLLPERWPGGAPYIVASSLECRGGILEELDPDSYRLHRFRIDEEPDHDRRILKILASAAIPWGFDPVEIDEKRFVDGGWDEKGGDNTPLRPIWRTFPISKRLSLCDATARRSIRRRFAPESRKVFACSRCGHPRPCRAFSETSPILFPMRRSSGNCPCSALSQTAWSAWRVFFGYGPEPSPLTATSRGDTLRTAMPTAWPRYGTCDRRKN